MTISVYFNILSDRIDMESTKKCGCLLFLMLASCMSTLFYSGKPLKYKKKYKIEMKFILFVIISFTKDIHNLQY